MKEKKQSISVGDSVKVYGRVYSYRDSATATVYIPLEVTKVHPDDPDEVIGVDPNGNAYSFHPKQCRRLVKRERRRVMLHIEDVVVVDGGSKFICAARPVGGLHPDDNTKEWREFIEVKRGF